MVSDEHGGDAMTPWEDRVAAFWNEADDADLNHMKIGVKLVVAVVILVIAIVGMKKERQNPGSTAALAHAAGALGILNVVIAVLW